MMQMRDARVEDAIAVAEVHVRAWKTAYRGLLPDDFLDALTVEQRATRYSFGSTEPAGRRTILAIQDGRILGFAASGPSRDADAAEAAELYALYVDPQTWRSGVGRKLMGEVYAHFEAMGVGEAILWVLRGNEQASRFYRADGWRPDGSRREEDVWDVPANVVRYRRVLR